MPKSNAETTSDASIKATGAHSETTVPQELADMAYLKLPDVLKAFPVSASTWYALIRHGIAPEPVKLGSGSFWRASGVRTFLARDPAEISEALRAVRNARKAGQRGAAV